MAFIFGFKEKKKQNKKKKEKFWLSFSILSIPETLSHCGFQFALCSSVSVHLIIL